MNEVNAKYEILYSDLRNHFIGHYLASRDFKALLSKKGAYSIWKDVFKSVEKKRSYIALGIDHEPGDAADTLGEFFNAIEKNPAIENFISEIIAVFIKQEKEVKDFSNVLESATFSKFKKENLEIIEEAIETYKKSDFSRRKETKTAALSGTNATNENQIKKKNETEPRMPKNNEVFIVHGHNQELRQNVARTLETLKLVPIILNEQLNEGLTVIEKFEKHSDVSFAIVLLTFDDFGNVKSTNSHNKRARQNVVLELGYFIAKLGRKNVLPLYEEGVELPSDMSGILYTKIDESENWKVRIIKELKGAGFKVDANDLI